MKKYLLMLCLSLSALLDAHPRWTGVEPLFHGPPVVAEDKTVQILIDKVDKLQEEINTATKERSELLESIKKLNTTLQEAYSGLQKLQETIRSMVQEKAVNLKTEAVSPEPTPQLTAPSIQNTATPSQPNKKLTWAEYAPTIGRDPFAYSSDRIRYEMDNDDD